MLEKRLLNLYETFLIVYTSYISLLLNTLFTMEDLLLQKIFDIRCINMTLALMIGMITLAMLLIKYLNITLTIFLLIMYLLPMLSLICVIREIIVISVHYIYILM